MKRQHMSPTEQYEDTLKSYALNDDYSPLHFVLDDWLLLDVRVLEYDVYAWSIVDMQSGKPGSWHLGSANEVARKMVEVEDEAEMVFELVE
jgi:hypothetical protein